MTLYRVVAFVLMFVSIGWKLSKSGVATGFDPTAEAKFVWDGDGVCVLVHSILAHQVSPVAVGW